MLCPNCGHEIEVRIGVQSGGIFSSDLRSEKQKEEETNPPFSPQIAKRPRGKAREYSEAFDTAWRLYGRKEEKFRAWGEWLIQARLAGGETSLLPLIVASLRWQIPMWNEVGWKYAPYFERYLKRRKWEDERPPVGPVKPRPIDSLAKSTAEMLDKRNAEAAAQTPVTREQLAALRRENGR